MVAKFYGIFKNLPSRFRAKMAIKAFISEQVMKVTWGLLPASDAINAIIGRLDLPKIPVPLSEYSARSVLINVIVQLFADSNPDSSESEGKGKPLGLLATELVMRITSLEDPAMMTLLENPVLHAYGNIEAQYLDLSRKAREIDTLGQGEWPLELRSMALPLSDEVFIDRAPEVESMAISRIAKVLIKDLKLWNEYPSFFS